MMCLSQIFQNRTFQKSLSWICGRYILTDRAAEVELYKSQGTKEELKCFVFTHIYIIFIYYTLYTHSLFFVDMYLHDNYFNVQVHFTLTLIHV